MAFIQIKAQVLRESVKREIYIARQTYALQQDAYNDAVSQNLAHKSQFWGAIERIYIELQKVWDSSHFRWGHSAPYRDENSVTFSMQFAKVVRETFEREFPELSYRWITKSGDLGTVVIPDKIRHIVIPDRSKLDALEEVLNKLPELGWVKLSEEQAKKYNVSYTPDDLVYELS